MTQALDRPALAIRFTPMDVPMTRPWEEGELSSIAVHAPAVVNPLMLHPGEPTEASVAVTNGSDRPLDLAIDVSGTFPDSWCQVLRSRQTLNPGETLNAILLLQVPDDYFEQADRGQLALEQRGQLRCFAHDDEGNGRLLRTLEFTLYLRPRSLYLDFLPDLYREVDFVGRLLKVFELAFEPDVRTLNGLWAYLNPRLAPQGMLPFLAHWVGWQISPDLSLDQQRELIAQALEIYRWRGTRRGLRLSLHLATGLPLESPSGEAPAIAITETFGSGLVLGETRLGPEAIMGGTKPFHFSVTLRQPPGLDLDENLIRKTIEQEKPAFCTYDLTIMPAPLRSPLPRRNDDPLASLP
ncbi:MAG: phage tail protein [Leptolyngbya sp. SIOISBB]|nr:phage tail protein [Leptolyngbya sp. SIOISBB]